MNSPNKTSQELRLIKISQGREAVAMAGVIHPYVQDRITMLVQNLAAMYRNGSVEHDKLIGTAAQITCLLDMLSDLEGRAKRGDIASSVEMNNAQKTN